MLSFSPSRTSLALGRGAGAWLLFAAVLGLASACSDDDPAPQTGGGAAGASDLPDASVRDLPGDGQLETPDFDTDRRQRAPIGPDGLNEAVDGLGNGGNSGRAPVEAPDAAPPAADADAG